MSQEVRSDAFCCGNCRTYFGFAVLSDVETLNKVGRMYAWEDDQVGVFIYSQGNTAVG